MHALDHDVGCEQQAFARRRGDHRGVIADPDLACGWFRQAAPDGFDRGKFAVAA